MAHGVPASLTGSQSRPAKLPDPTLLRKTGFIFNRLMIERGAFRKLPECGICWLFLTQNQKHYVEGKLVTGYLRWRGENAAVSPMRRSGSWLGHAPGTSSTVLFSLNDGVQNGHEMPAVGRLRQEDAELKPACAATETVAAACLHSLFFSLQWTEVF